MLRLVDKLPCRPFGCVGRTDLFKVDSPGPLYATEYTGYPNRPDADFAAALPPSDEQSSNSYMSSSSRVADDQGEGS